MCNVKNRIMAVIPLRSVQGHPRSLIFVPIESTYAVSYYCSTVTLVLSCTFSEIRRVIGQKRAKIAHSNPHQSQKSTSLGVTPCDSWAHTRGAQLSTGYTVNTYSKPPLYGDSKCGSLSLSFMQQQKTSALGKPDVDLFIARTERHETDTTYHQPTSQPK